MRPRVSHHSNTCVRTPTTTLFYTIFTFHFNFVIKNIKQQHRNIIFFSRKITWNKDKIFKYSNIHINGGTNIHNNSFFFSFCFPPKQKLLILSWTFHREFFIFFFFIFLILKITNVQPLKMKKGMVKKREKQIFVMDGIFRVFKYELCAICTYMNVRIRCPCPKYNWCEWMIGCYPHCLTNHPADYSHFRLDLSFTTTPPLSHHQPNQWEQ